MCGVREHIQIWKWERSMVNQRGAAGSKRAKRCIFLK